MRKCNSYESYVDFVESKYGKINRLKNVSGIEHLAFYKLSDRVIKITTNEKEARACKRIFGRDFKNVVKVHNIHEFYVCSEFKNGYVKTYAFELEKLSTTKLLSDYDEELNFSKLISKHSFETTKKLLTDVINGYEELSSIGVYHKDIHTQNVLYDKRTNNYKIIDFGIVKIRNNM